MKLFIFYLLLLTLSANIVASAGECLMNHEKMEHSSQSMAKSMAQSVEKSKSQAMSCHQGAEQDNTADKPHICECDKCSQYIDSYVAVTPSNTVADLPIIYNRQHQSFTPAQDIRPPIYSLT